MRFKSICKKDYLHMSNLDRISQQLIKGELYTIEFRYAFENSPKYEEYEVIFDNGMDGLLIFGDRSFKEYFYTKDEMRDNKLNELLK